MGPSHLRDRHRSVNSIPQPLCPLFDNTNGLHLSLSIDTTLTLSTYVELRP